MKKKWFIAVIFSVSLLLFSKIDWIQSENCVPQTKIRDHENFEVGVLEYVSKKNLGNIIIVPPTGGTNLIDRSYAKSFCAEGFNTFVINHWTDDNEYNPELEIHTRFYGRAHRAIRILLDTLPKDSFIGIVGTSVGGLHAAIATSRFPEIKAAFIITGGAHIPSIVAYSTQVAMENVWLERKKIYGFKDREEYVKALEKVIKLEPMGLIGSKKKLGMVIGQKDTVVPTRNQKLLQTLWSPQKVITFNYDHFLSIVFTWLFKTSDIVSFFREATSVE